ncbi:MAG: PEP-CTERM sorting domain-containing protein [Armatimonadetes bacterium]|nr:PEP-CTERM sorting domain-containing protein [Armatimonadota bacterium]
MNRIVGIVCAIVACVLLLTSAAGAWDVQYVASTGLLPTSASPAWQLFLHNDPIPTVADGILRIQHTGTASYVEYSREGYAIDAGVPVTVEARVRAAETSSGASRLSIQTKGCYASLLIYPDHIAAADHSAGGWVTLSGDFTTFRAIRVAYDGGMRAYAWVDDEPAFSWGLSGSAGQDGVNFGSCLGAGPCDSYWQYVAYSKQFVPVPEPSSLIALAGGLAGLGGTALRRRRA